MIQHTHKELAELVRKAQAKDSEAFARLYEATYQQLYYYILTLVRNRQDAEDLVQNIYVIVLKKLDTLKEGSVFVAWLNHIAYNECMHLLSSRKNAPSGELYDSEAENLPDHNAESDPLLQSVKSDRQRRVMAAIETLEPEFKTVIIMQYYNNMKLADIAVVLGCPVGTVKSRAFAAKQQLKKALAGQEELRFNMFIPFLLSKTLKASASNISMPAAAAQKTLTAALAQAGMPANVSFTAAQNAATAAAAVAGATAAGTAAATGAVWFGTLGVAAAATAAVVAVTGAPGITATTYDTAPARETTVVVSTEGVQQEAGVLYTAPDGTQHRAAFSGDGEYRFIATENGTYVVQAFGSHGKSVTENVAVDTLDYTAPQVDSYTWEGDILTLHVSDDKAGINYSDIFASGNTGEFIPQQVDEATGTVIFEMQQDEFYIFMEDMLGNHISYLVTVNNPA